MGRIIVQQWMTLDGVIQSPAYPDEDPSGGFTHGGWHPPYLDEVAMDWVVEGVANASGFLFGRRTYDNFAAYWPTAPPEVDVLARPLTQRPKYVASTTLREPLGWQNVRLLRQPVLDDIAALRRDTDGYLLMVGSTTLTQALLDAGLVDEFRLMIDPVVVGGGKRLFADDGKMHKLQLKTQQTTERGAMLATYAAQPASAPVAPA